MTRALTLITLIAPLLASAPARAQTSCVSCHERSVEARLRGPIGRLRGDAHDRAGIDCVGCHGGDPDDPTAAAHDLAGGFVGRPGDAGAPRMCGGCHDGSTEAPAVLAAYRRGRHAQALAEGRRGAGCASCHGGHGIGAEPAPRARVVGTCAACHADPARMEGSGLPTDQARQWTRSVHGAAVAAGSEEAPVCSSCHDPHENEAGLAPVRRCGECHEPIEAAFDDGPHREAFAPLGFLDCAECHGSHEVARPGGAMLQGLDSVCGRCHGHGQPLFESVTRITALAPAIDRVRAAVPRDGAQRVQMAAALHALDVERLEAVLAELPPAPPSAPEPVAPSAEGNTSAVQVGAGVVLALALVGLFVSFRRRR